jgi:hypothetical protein
VLETLTPAERLAFVLHDTFAVPFGDIAPIVGRSPAAAAQGRPFSVLGFAIAGVRSSRSTSSPTPSASHGST